MTFSKVGNLSIVVGSGVCNARCKFCIARLTPANGITTKNSSVAWVPFGVACKEAFEGKIDSVLLTSKGEPTLFPHDISSYLTHLRFHEQANKYEVPSVELQTNGIAIWEKGDVFNPLLDVWKSRGLDLVAISIVHFDAEMNRRNYVPYKNRYINLSGLIKKLHDRGYKVRLSVVLQGGYLDTVGKCSDMIDWALNEAVEQLTLRPVAKPGDVYKDIRDPEAAQYVTEHAVRGKLMHELRWFAENKLNARSQGVTPYGAATYEHRGMSLFLSNCLTHDDPRGEYARQMIFYPSGQVVYDWEEEIDPTYDTTETSPIEPVVLSIGDQPKP